MSDDALYAHSFYRRTNRPPLDPYTLHSLRIQRKHAKEEDERCKEEQRIHEEIQKLMGNVKDKAEPSEEEQERRIGKEILTIKDNEKEMVERVKEENRQIREDIQKLIDIKKDEPQPTEEEEERRIRKEIGKVKDNNKGIVERSDEENRQIQEEIQKLITKKSRKEQRIRNQKKIEELEAEIKKIQAEMDEEQVESDEDENISMFQLSSDTKEESSVENQYEPIFRTCSWLKK